MFVKVYSTAHSLLTTGTNGKNPVTLVILFLVSPTSGLTLLFDHCSWHLQSFRWHKSLLHPSRLASFVFLLYCSPSSSSFPVPLSSSSFTIHHCRSPSPFPSHFLLHLFPFPFSYAIPPSPFLLLISATSSPVSSLEYQSLLYLMDQLLTHFPLTDSGVPRCFVVLSHTFFLYFHRWSTKPCLPACLWSKVVHPYIYADQSILNPPPFFFGIRLHH